MRNLFCALAECLCTLGAIALVVDIADSHGTGVHMKKLIVVLASAFFLMLLLISAFGIWYYVFPLGDERVFRANYIARYESTLNAMFDYEWTVISVEERILNREVCSCMRDQRAWRYLAWTIEYKNWNDETGHFVLRNSHPFYSQVVSYVRHIATEYFKEHFLYAHMYDVLDEHIGTVHVSIARAIINRNSAEGRAWARASDQYRRNLGTPGGAIPLSQLNPANIFEMIPMYLSIRISLNEYSGEDKQAFEESVISKMEGMIEDINRFTNGRVNAMFSVGYRNIINMHHGSRSYRWYYIQGERVYGLNSMFFGRYVFERYRSMFR